MATFEKDATMNPVKPAPNAGRLKVKKGLKSRHPPTCLRERPPWEHHTVGLRFIDKFQERTSCRSFDVQLRAPDYLCTPAKRYRILSDGRHEEDGDVYLLRKPWVAADWCNPPQHSINVKRCTVWGTGHPPETTTKTKPNNYKLAYIDPSRLESDPDYQKEIDPETVYKEYPNEPLYDKDGNRHIISHETEVYYKVE